MPLYKTTILPPGDPEAETTFRDLIEHHPFLLLVVLGDHRPLVEAADLLAGGAVQNSWRRVVWVQQPEDVRDLLKELDGTRSSKLPSILGTKVAGFSVSLTDQVRDVILTTQLRLAKVRALKAYAAAEAHP